MYIRMKTSKKAKYPTMQIVEGVREGKKVKQRTVAHLGVVKIKKTYKGLKTWQINLSRGWKKKGLKSIPKWKLRT